MAGKAYLNEKSQALLIQPENTKIEYTNYIFG